MAVRSAKGQMVDLAALVQKNATKPALGNGKMNARGDIIERNGNIVKKREDVLSDYYKNNPRAVETQSGSLRSIDQEVLTPAEVMERLNAVKKEKVSSKKKITLSDE